MYKTRNKMNIIPLGADCATAIYLQTRNLRQTAYPFDWNVSYFDFDRIISNKFQDFLPSASEQHTDCTFFMHDVFPRDREKYARRIERFWQDVSGPEVFLLRIGHSEHHHYELANLKNHKEDHVMDEISQMNNAISAIRGFNPGVVIKAWLFLACFKCVSSVQADDGLQVYDISQKIPLVDRENLQAYYNERERVLFEELDSILAF